MNTVNATIPPYPSTLSQFGMLVMSFGPENGTARDAERTQSKPAKSGLKPLQIKLFKTQCLAL